MSARTVWVLNLNRPGNSLALWLALNVPDLFLYEAKRVRRGLVASSVASGLGRLQALGQDDDSDSDDDSDDDTGDDYSDEDTGSDDFSSDDGVLSSSSDESPQQTLGLEPVTVDTSDLGTSALDPSLLTEDSSTLDQAGSSTGTSGQSVASAASSAGSTVQQLIGAVGSALTSSQEISSLANAATQYFAAQAANNAAAAALADVTGTQLALAQTGQTVAPVTVANGQPAIASTAADGSTTLTPISSEQLASLTPSSLSVFFAQYGVYLAVGGVGAVALVLLVASSRRRRWR